MLTLYDLSPGDNEVIHPAQMGVGDVVVKVLEVPGDVDVVMREVLEVLGTSDYDCLKTVVEVVDKGVIAKENLGVEED